MAILVTGNRGYIGTVLTEELRNRGYQVIGLDVDYYAGCELKPLPPVTKQIIKDIRDVESTDLANVDAIIHLAALSNDPLGELKVGLTEEINFQGTMRLANLAKQNGVPRFVYASSQSMYGIAKTDVELDEDNSEKNPLTAYAKTKWDAECALQKLLTPKFTVTAMRPSTVFGASPRLRCDIVYNNLLAYAYTTGNIEIKTDGTPWRPVIHVKDVSSAFMAGLEAPENLVAGRAFNVGLQNGNYRVRDLAEAAQQAVPGSKIVYTGTPGSTDPRTYRVGFNRIFSVLKDYYRPSWTLADGGRELVNYFKEVGFTQEHFNHKTIRLQQFKLLQSKNLIDGNLRWVGPR